MGGQPSPVLRAHTDSRDRLIEADGPLAALQLGMGGAIPGIIAAPALLELVRKARSFGLKLSRRIEALGREGRISAWAEALPDADGQGCQLRISDWRSIPIDDTVAEADGRSGSIGIARDIAELILRLGPGQEVLTAAAYASDTADVAARMNEGAGRRWTEFVEPDSDGDERHGGWRQWDGRALRLPGSTRHWTAHLVPLGQPAGAAGFELLLTADEALAATPEPADHKDAAGFVHGGLGRELAPVLRQPVARIIANAETIRSQLAGPLAEEYANYAADIASAGEHLLALIEDLSDLEAVEDAHFSTLSEPIDMADIARRAAGILAMRAQQKSIAVEAPSADVTAAATGEFKRALQIVLNLLGNAIRYSPEGSRIWLKVEEAEGFARLTVTDEGAGIDVDAQRRIFDKFERLGRSGDGGSGLGLYISRRLARAMGGELHVTSEPGNGARFLLELPVEAGRQ